MGSFGSKTVQPHRLRRWRDALRQGVRRAGHQWRHRVADEVHVRTGPRQRRQRCRSRLVLQPAADAFAVQDDRHPVMDGAAKAFGAVVMTVDDSSGSEPGSPYRHPPGMDPRTQAQAGARFGRRGLIGSPLSATSISVPKAPISWTSGTSASTWARPPQSTDPRCPGFGAAGNKDGSWWTMPGRAARPGPASRTGIPARSPRPCRPSPPRLADRAARQRRCPRRRAAHPHPARTSSTTASFAWSRSKPAMILCSVPGSGEPQTCDGLGSRPRAWDPWSSRCCHRKRSGKLNGASHRREFSPDEPR